MRNIDTPHSGDQYYYINVINRHFCIASAKAKRGEDITQDYNAFLNDDNLFYLTDKIVDIQCLLMRLHQQYCKDFIPNWNDEKEKKFFIVYDDIGWKAIKTQVNTFTVVFDEVGAQKAITYLNRFFRTGL